MPTCSAAVLACCSAAVLQGPHSHTKARCHHATSSQDVWISVPFIIHANLQRFSSFPTGPFFSPAAAPTCETSHGSGPRDSKGRGRPAGGPNLAYRVKLSDIGIGWFSWDFLGILQRRLLHGLLTFLPWRLDAMQSITASSIHNERAASSSGSQGRAPSERRKPQRRCRCWR